MASKKTTPAATLAMRLPAKVGDKAIVSITTTPPADPAVGAAVRIQQQESYLKKCFAVAGHPEIPISSEGADEWSWQLQPLGGEVYPESLRGCLSFANWPAGRLSVQQEADRLRELLADQRLYAMNQHPHQTGRADGSTLDAVVLPADRDEPAASGDITAAFILGAAAAAAQPGQEMEVAQAPMADMNPVADWAPGGRTRVDLPTPSVQTFKPQVGTTNDGRIAISKTDEHGQPLEDWRPEPIHDLADARALPDVTHGVYQRAEFDSPLAIRAFKDNDGRSMAVVFTGYTLAKAAINP